MWLKRQSGVPKATLAQLGSLETEVMERIWTRGEISVRDLHHELSGRLAYTTLMTTLDRLFKKALLQRRKQGKAFFYVPACTEQEYQEQLTGHLFGMALRENKDRDAVLSCFVETISENDSEMLDRLDEMVKAKRRALRRKE